MQRQNKVRQPESPLIQDIIELILQYIVADDQDNSGESFQRRKWLRKRLSVCSRIGRVWRRPAQRILFAEVDIRTRHKLKMLQHVVPNYTSQGRFLRGCVRSLRLWVDGLERPGNLWPADIPVSMRNFPSLYELRLDVDSVSSLNSDVLYALRDTPRIQALMLTGRVPTSHDGRKLLIEQPTNIDFQLLVQVPHWKLRHFVLGKGLRISCRKSPSPTHQFIEFRFHGDISCNGEHYVSRGINWYIQNSKLSLRVFSTTRVEYYPPMLPLANKNGLLSVEIRDLGQEVSTHAGLEGVKELMWLRAHPSFGWRQLIIPVALVSRMKNLIHLGIDTGYYDWDYHLSRWLKIFPKPEIPTDTTPSFSTNLKRLTIVGFYSKKYPVQFIQNQLQKVFEDDVEVRVYPSLREYKDEVALKLVPRECTISSSSIITDWFTMTKLVNQAHERSLSSPVSSVTPRGKSGASARIP
ncbi:hypothetical protein CPB86DRAFT_782886 [Serendipita vermifera]|nr:hypothetical protein CPB86DRAFT_782886 [Serendipita vermifera]